MKRSSRLMIHNLPITRTGGGKSNEDSKFDRVVRESKDVKTPVELGFGGTTLLNVIDNPAVRPTYTQLRSLGHRVHVFVRKIHDPSFASGDQFGQRIVNILYTFQVWKRTGFVHSKPVASFDVDVREDYGVADGPATEYVVSPIVKMTERIAGCGCIGSPLSRQRYEKILREKSMTVGEMQELLENDASITAEEATMWLDQAKRELSPE